MSDPAAPRRADTIQTVAAVATALTAAAALVLIPLQLAEAERVQREQAAREIYREFLNLTVSRPELATADYCAMTDGTERLRYKAYVEYLVHTGEQVVEISEDWALSVRGWMEDHGAYLCGPDLSDAGGDVRDLMDRVGMTCPATQACATAG
jgi:hypothetical protein